ncbi:MAG: DUF4349 domain-containing protein [Candidatus Nanohaloarchaea archaeon]
MIEKLRDSSGLQYAALASGLVAVMAVGFVAQSFSTSSQGDALQTQKAYRDVSLAASGDSAASSPMYAVSYRMSLEVSDVREAMNAVGERAKGLGGRIESESFDRRRGVNGDMNVLVPKENVTEFVSGIESDYRVESFSKQRQDVSDQYTETRLELRNKRQELRQLEELMNRTESVDSLIKIQERMSELRSRIQYLEQRKEEIREDVEYVDVSISLERPGVIDTDFNLRESLANAYSGIFQSLNLLIVGTGYLLPFALLGALVYGLRRIYSERF